MSSPNFTQVSYIRATPQEVWNALTDPDITNRYWFGRQLESDWRLGSAIRATADDGLVSHSGEVLECVPPQRLSFSWRIDYEERLRNEGHSRIGFDLEPAGPCTKLTLTHDRFPPDSTVAEIMAVGLPMVMASLKSLIETGIPLDAITGAAATKAAKKFTAAAAATASSQ